MIGRTYLELKLFKNPLNNNKATRNVKDFLIKKFTSHFNLMLLNTTNLSNSFHGQSSSKNTIFPVLKSWTKLVLNGLRNTIMGIYFLTLRYTEWAKYQILCTADAKNERSFTLTILYSIASCQK